MDRFPLSLPNTFFSFILGNFFGNRSIVSVSTLQELVSPAGPALLLFPIFFSSLSLLFYGWRFLRSEKEKKEKERKKELKRPLREQKAGKGMKIKEFVKRRKALGGRRKRNSFNRIPLGAPSHIKSFLYPSPLRAPRKRCA